MQFIPPTAIVVEPLDAQVSIIVSIQGEGHPLYPVGASIADTGAFIGPVSTYVIQNVVCKEISDFVRVNGTKDIMIMPAANTFTITSKFTDLFTRVFKYTTHYPRESVTWDYQELRNPRVISTGDTILRVECDSPELFRARDTIQIGEVMPHLYSSVDNGQTYTLKATTEYAAAIAEWTEKQKFTGTWAIRTVPGVVPATAFTIQVNESVAAGTYQLLHTPYNTYRVVDKARFISPLDEDTRVEDYTAVYQMVPPPPARQLSYAVSGAIDTQQYTVTPVTQVIPQNTLEEFTNKQVSRFSARVRATGEYNGILIIESLTSFTACVKTAYSTLVLEISPENIVYPLPVALLGGDSKKLDWCEIDLFVNDEYGENIAHCHTRHYNYTANGASTSEQFSTDWSMTLESSWEVTNAYLQHAITRGGESKKTAEYNRNIP